MNHSISLILENAEGGARITEEEALLLFQTKGSDIWKVAAAADRFKKMRTGDAVTFVCNQNINVTNCCINSCGFCGFSRRPSEDGIYFYSDEEIRGRAAEAKTRGVTEICTVSGLHPDFTAETYASLYALLKEAAQGVHIHAGNPMEVAYGAGKSGISSREALLMMKDAGLDSLCGTAAEILVDEVRQKICPGKIDSDTWERIIREAHEMNIPTTATIMYGHIESDEDRVSHLARLRSIQDDTGGFTEFVPLSFIHQNTPLYRAGAARAGATGREDLLMYAVSRLFLDNFTHIQSSWVKLGKKCAQLVLAAGADDLGGTMFEERISSSAGAMDTDYLPPEEMARMASDLGLCLGERTTLYSPVHRNHPLTYK